MSDPLYFVSFCGKVGHGTKDCDEKEEEGEQDIKYGGWLKTCPWKVRGERHSHQVRKEKNRVLRLFLLPAQSARIRVSHLGEFKRWQSS